MAFEFLTKKEAAERLRCSQRFLETRIKEGDLAATRLGPHKVLIRSDCLQAWLERCTVSGVTARLSIGGDGGSAGTVIRVEVAA